MDHKQREELFREEFIELYSELDFKLLLNKIAEKTKNYLDCEGASFFLYDHLREELYFEVVAGDKSEVLKKVVLRKGEGIAGWIAESGESVLINDCHKDSRFNSKIDKKVDFKTRSILGVPVVMGNKLLGVLEAINKKTDEFNEDDLKILKYISGFITIPMHNALLFNKVTQETKNKDQLLELAKGISSSQSPDDVLEILKNIIISLIDPIEITVFVHSKGKSYNLISKNKEKIGGKKNKGLNDTYIGNKTAVFPLRTQKKTIGFIEIDLKNIISNEMSFIIKGLSVFAAISIEKFELYEHLIEKEKIEKELQIAREIQQSFLLKDEIIIPNIDVAFVNITSSEVGGDYYDIIKLNENETVYTINDISGHGVPASLLMAIFRTNFTYLTNKNKNILKTITELNELISKTTDPNLYVTSFTAVIDTNKKCIKYINSGHNAPFIIREDKAISLDEGTLVLGMFPDVPYEIHNKELINGDIIVLYTDGVIESENSSEEEFSIELLIDIVKQNRELSAEKIKEVIISELKNFTKKASFIDDVTFMIIKFENSDS